MYEVATTGTGYLYYRSSASRDQIMWKKAAWLSLDFGDAIFETFDLFGPILLTIRGEDIALPLRLKEAIDVAERLMGGVHDVGMSL